MSPVAVTESQQLRLAHLSRIIIDMISPIVYAFDAGEEDDCDMDIGLIADT
jgi:hypothetical protein